MLSNDHHRRIDEYNINEYCCVVVFVTLRHFLLNHLNHQIDAVVTQAWRNLSQPAEKAVNVQLAESE